MSSQALNDVHFALFVVCSKPRDYGFSPQDYFSYPCDLHARRTTGRAAERILVLRLQRDNATFNDPLVSTGMDEKKSTFWPES